MTASSPTRRGLISKSSKKWGDSISSTPPFIHNIHSFVKKCKSLCNQTLVDKVLKSHNLAAWYDFNNRFYIMILNNLMKKDPNPSVV